MQFGAGADFFMFRPTLGFGWLLAERMGVVVDYQSVFWGPELQPPPSLQAAESPSPRLLLSRLGSWKLE